MKIVFTRSSTIYDDSRATKEIVAFLENGFIVTVLGWNRNGLAEIKCRELFEDYKESVSFRFYTESTGTSRIQKIISRRKWNKWLVTELGAITEIDAIHACDYDTGAAVRRYAHKHSIKYVYDIYDYYVDAHPVPNILKKVIEKDEIRTINESEATIICTEERKIQIKKSHPKKVIVIYNSPDVGEYESCEEQYDYVYCGSLYNGRLIKEILDRYPEYEQYRFIIAGYGEYEHQAALLASMYNGFTFLGSIPYSEVLEVEKKSKVISAIYEPTITNHQLCAPNKFYEALALGKPVIVCRGTGIDKIVEQEKIGRVIEYDSESFYSALQTLLFDETTRKQMGKNARKLYETNYKWSLMIEQLIDIYKYL